MKVIELYVFGHIRDEKLSTQGGNALQRYVSVTQQVEYMTFNHRVKGSNPFRHTKLQGVKME